MSESKAVLPGQGATDYERYLHTDELLMLQKTPTELAHRDELTFQVATQVSELWLKLACHEIKGAIEKVRAGELTTGARLLRRASRIMQSMIDELAILEQIRPGDYHRFRGVLGNGSGFDSPGFRQIWRLAPLLWESFVETGLDPVDVYRQSEEGQLQLAESFIEWDEAIMNWRARHYQTVVRVLGDACLGTQGTPIEVLGKLIHDRLFPRLWEARNHLTALAASQGGVKRS